MFTITIIYNMRSLIFGVPKEHRINSSETLSVSELPLCALLSPDSTTYIHVGTVIDYHQVGFQ